MPFCDLPGTEGGVTVIVFIELQNQIHCIIKKIRNLKLYQMCGQIENLVGMENTQLDNLALLMLNNIRKAISVTSTL